MLGCKQVKYVFATTTTSAQALLPSCDARSAQCRRGARSPNNGPPREAVGMGMSHGGKKELGRQKHRRFSDFAARSFRQAWSN